MNIYQPQKLDKIFADAIKRHNSRFGESVRLLSYEIEKEYIKEVKQTLSFLVNDEKIAEITAGGHNFLKSLFSANYRIGRQLCDFGPPLNLWPVEDFPIAMIVYSAIRFANDGLDGNPGHKTIKQKSFYGYLIDEKVDEQKAGALNTMVNAAVMNAAIIRLNEKNSGEIADTLLRLSHHVLAGMTAESIPAEPLTLDLYKRVVERRLIACRMMLDHVFLRKADPAIRAKLLQISSRLFEIEKITDDLSGKKRGGTDFNILNIPGIDRRTVEHMIEVMFQELFNDSRSLAPELQDMLALRTANQLKKTVRAIKQ